MLCPHTRFKKIVTELSERKLQNKTLKVLHAQVELMVRRIVLLAKESSPRKTLTAADVEGVIRVLNRAGYGIEGSPRARELPGRMGHHILKGVARVSASGQEAVRNAYIGCLVSILQIVNSDPALPPEALVQTSHVAPLIEK